MRVAAGTTERMTCLPNVVQNPSAREALPPAVFLAAELSLFAVPASD
jgi:hypothetical protein